MLKSGIPRFIIFALPGLGDIVNFLPTLESLFKAYPLGRFDVLVMFRSTYEIMKAYPQINEVIFADFMNMSKIESALFALKLRRKHYDISIMSYPANRIEYNILSFLVGAKIRIAHKYKHFTYVNLPFLNNRLIEQTEALHNVQENMRLLVPLGLNPKDPEHLVFPLKEEDEEFANRFIREAGIETRYPIFGIHAFSTTFKNMHRKCWDAENFAKLIDNLAENYNSAAFLLFGSRIDETANNYIMEHTKHKPILATNLPITKTAAIIKKCNLFITNDSGLMHIASAMRVKTVALFGPTNPAWLHPWGTDYKIVRVDLPCSPCFYYSQKPLNCKRKEKDYLCMKAITVEMVANACTELLG